VTPPYAPLCPDVSGRGGVCGGGRVRGRVRGRGVRGTKGAGCPLKN
jgi:hypothetical protein